MQLRTAFLISYLTTCGSSALSLVVIGIMSEADRVFPTRKRHGSNILASERRHILSAARRSGLGAGQSRVVEVVHVRREGARPAQDQPGQAPWNLRAEGWLETFRTKLFDARPQQDAQPAAQEPTPPVVHVMPMWQPSPMQPAGLAAKPSEPLVEPAPTRQRSARIPRTPKSKTLTRQFADPFTDDGGTNCYCCGYLVEPARETRGLMTCSACG